MREFFFHCFDSLPIRHLHDRLDMFERKMARGKRLGGRRPGDRISQFNQHCQCTVFLAGNVDQSSSVFLGTFEALKVFVSFVEVVKHFLVLSMQIRFGVFFHLNLECQCFDVFPFGRNHGLVCFMSISISSTHLLELSL